MVELDKETIESLISEKEQRLLELDGQMASIQREVDRLKSALNGSRSNAQLSLPTKTQSGRVKRGESEKLITQYLTMQKGAGGVATKEVSESTGVTYGTAHRILNQLLEIGKVKLINGNWIWV